MVLEKQISFLQTINTVRPENISFVNELADLLKISNDSAYRRLRGETSLSFDEISKLCNHYNISFDAFNSTNESRVVSFKYQKMVGNRSNFHNYFKDLSKAIKQVASLEDEYKKVVYAGQGMPIFYYFKYPTLASFKIFHWLTTGVGNQNTVSQFDMSERNEELLEVGKEIYADYLRIPSIEIWSDTIVLGTIHQIQFYWDSGQFTNSETALKVCEEFRFLLEHVQEMCTHGKKSDSQINNASTAARLDFYYCEIELEKVCVLVKAGDLKRVYMGQLTFGSMFTENQDYYNETESWLDSTIKKSSLISEVSQKIRHQFFKRCFKNLRELETRIKVEI